MWKVSSSTVLVCVRARVCLSMYLHATRGINEKYRVDLEEYNHPLLLTDSHSLCSHKNIHSSVYSLKQQQQQQYTQASTHNTEG